MNKYESRPDQRKISIEEYREIKSAANKLRLLSGAKVTEQDFSTDVSFTRFTDTTGIYTHNIFSVEIYMGEVPQVNQHTISLHIACFGLTNLVPELIYKRGVNIKVIHGVVERAWQTTEIPTIVAPPEAQPAEKVELPDSALFIRHDRELKAGGEFGPIEASYLIEELASVAHMDSHF